MVEYVNMSILKPMCKQRFRIFKNVEDGFAASLIDLEDCYISHVENGVRLAREL